MERYDYFKNICNDIRNYIECEQIDVKNLDDAEIDNLYDTLFLTDSVTGNASGSYTFSTYLAEEYVCHNLDLLGKALEEFCCDYNVLQKGAEWCDVTIRCYLLQSCLTKVLSEYNDEE